MCTNFNIVFIKNDNKYFENNIKLAGPHMAFLNLKRVYLLEVPWLWLQMTGAFGLALMELLTEINFLKLKAFIKSLAASDTEEILSQLGMLINAGYTLICFVFMLMGVLLFLSTLSENDDLIHTCVWGTFINAMFGLAVTIALFINCLSQDSCLLSSVDWFSAAIIFFILILSIMFWVYNSCITHSYLEYKKKSN